jgi:hypothetical protein
MIELLENLTPIEGGYCVRRLDDRCVHVIRMMYNWRVALTEPVEKESHEIAFYSAEWCYFGHGVDAAGRERTMASAFQAAVTAVLAWDGVGDPPGFNKRVGG